MNTENMILKMLLIRWVEQEIIARYGKQQIRCPVHLSIGQEAIAVGVCQYLRKSDSVFSTHRSHAHYLSKGGNLDRMALELHGKIGGCNDGRGGSMHLNDKDVNVMSIPIVASAIPLAVGVALANKMDGDSNIVVCFFGDAAIEEGVFSESMNFASLMQLPIIFVCENNQYSVDTHISKRQRNSMKYTGLAHGVRQHRMDGQDVFKIADVMNEIIFDARQNNEPQFIIFDTERSYVHCGVDKEFELRNDPIEIALREYKGPHKVIAERIVRKEISIIFDKAESAPLPSPDMASKYVYA